MTTKALEKPQGGLPAVRTGVPRGLENFNRKDLMLARISLMQGLSKLVTREGKKLGDFVNILTKETLGTSFEFIPISVTKYFDLLKPDPNKQGDFAFDTRTYDENDARLEGRRFFNEKGKEKANVNAVISYLILVDGEPALLNFSKTAYKSGKKLGTLAMMSGKDLFATRWKATSKAENRNNNDFFGIEIEEIGPASEIDFKIAEKLYESFGKNLNTLVDKAEKGGDDESHSEPTSAAPAAESGAQAGGFEEAPASAPATPSFTKVRVLKTVRTDEDKKCPNCQEVRVVKDGNVKTNDPETNLPWGKVKALVCKKCNKVDVVEKVAD